MARQNDSLVYPQSGLTICRSLTAAPRWEVRGPLGFAVEKVATEKGGQRTTYVRVEQEGAVLELVDNGAKARLAAVRHAVNLGLITEEAGATETARLSTPKKAAKK